jgi:hypothetical protein
MRPLTAYCHQRLVWLYERTGNTPDLERHRAAAAPLLERMGRPVKLDGAAVF